MFQVTLCNYPAVFIEVFKYGYYTAPILLTSGFFIAFWKMYPTYARFSALPSLILSLGCTFVLLNLSALFTYAKGDTTDTEVSTFNTYLSGLNKTKFNESEKSQIKDLARCAIQDGNISKFEYELLEHKYKYFNSIYEEKEALREKQQAIKITQSAIDAK